MPIPKKAVIYVGATIALGFAVLVKFLLNWECPDLPRYLAYLALAIIGSTLKVRIPRINSTMSVNVLSILIGIVEFTAAETIALACACGLAQSVWRRHTRPKARQVLFNMAALSISSVAAYTMFHFMMETSDHKRLPILFPLAVCVYFIINTGLVAGVLSLIENKSWLKMWQSSYFSSFPLYLIGAAIAALVCISDRALGQGVLLISLTMYLAYLFFELYFRSRRPGATEAKV
jgi:hypothetical protein